jgi:hypothetical protein
MTETDWLTGTDFIAHLRFAADQLSPRRQRLLAVGLCRAASHLFDRPELTHALAVIDDYADGLVSAAEVEKTRQRCRGLAQEAFEEYRTALDRRTGDGLAPYVRSQFAWTVSYATNKLLQVTDVGSLTAATAAQAHTGLQAPLVWNVSEEITIEQSLVMRSVVWEVIGNPFRPVGFSPDWRTDTVVALARQMYAAREFGAMPILADALQDAGCADEDVLAHCRDTSANHIRGCWVVDGVLGKE